MKKIKKNKLEQHESYLVFVGYSWSPSGFDIAVFDGRALVSQSNGQDFLSLDFKIGTIYQLPIADY